MIKYYLCSLLFLLNIHHSQAQCDPIPIDAAQLFLLVSSEDAAQPSVNMLDDDDTTFWRTNGNTPAPHIMEMDLGGTYTLEEIHVLPRQDNKNGRLAGYEVYADLTGDFSQAQSIGTLQYDSPEDSTIKVIRFGAIKAQFLKIIATSNFDPSNRNRLMIAELDIYESPCAELGRENQLFHFTSIPKQVSSTNLVPEITSTSGLIPQLEVVSGPAIIVDTKVEFTGEEGEVTLRAFHEGNEDFYPSEAFHTFQVIDPNLYAPMIRTRLTEAYSLEMPELMPYLLTATTSIEHSDVLNIEKVEFEIDGTLYPAEAIKDAHQLLWQPSSYGQHVISVHAQASNGVSMNETRTIFVEIPSGEAKTAQALDKDLILFGGQNSRWLYKTVRFPQSVGAYKKIMADFWTTCPNVPGNCDDWDRKAWIEVKGPDGNWIEIIRYITPYGRGCEHQIDLTDYASILQGEVELRMFIDTWGTGGWDVHLRLNYEPGAPEFTYSYVQPIWDGTYDFGNPLNLQPVDTVNYQFPEDAQKAKLRVATTGHGWGGNNSQNAAEFYDATHFFNVNGVRTFTQRLWVQCDPNPDGCEPQAGTYRFPRAGWCPGALAELYEYNFTPYIGNAPLELSYIFDPRYVDLCHPNNSACVSGLTCEDCNAGFNPHYEVAANMIIYGNAPVLNKTESIEANKLGLSIFPNPAQDYFKLQLAELTKAFKVELQSLDGRVLQQQEFAQSKLLHDTRFDISKLAAGIYLVQVETEDFVSSVKLVKE